MIRIGKYSAEEIPIGCGGMGQVLKGYDQTGNLVAIKEILPVFVQDVEYRARIESEINFLKKLNNEHVVKVYDHFEIDGKLYIVMEYVDGLNIEEYVVNKGRMAWQDAVKYMIALLHTMQDVHEHGIVHRDIKPSNIMIRKNGDICLLDFGVAKDVSQNNILSNGGTVFGTVIGTDGYMSPEQASGLSIDHRSDIYALGCVLYYMLTGAHAFGSEKSELEMQKAISQGNFPKLSESVIDLPSSLQNVIDHAVDKNMIRRIQSCREFVGELMAVLPGGTAISTVGGTDNLTVSIGRENCDICVGSQNFKVSRHHGDVKLRNIAGKEILVYTDCSSNGTLINGQMLRKGMSYEIPKGDKPEILLAGVADCKLNIDEVIAFLDQRQKKFLSRGESRTKGRLNASGNVKVSLDGKNSKSYSVNTDTLTGAVMACLKKYADFKGRATRSEFWWFILFYYILQSLGLLVSVLFDLKPVSLAVIGGVIWITMFCPLLSVTVRRFHDIDKSGRQLWFALLVFVPVLGWLALVFFGIRWLLYLLRPGNPEANRFGKPV